MATEAPPEAAGTVERPRRRLAPRWRIEQRSSPANTTWLRLGAIAIGLGLGALVVAVSVDEPSLAYGDAWLGTFGSATGWSNVLTLAATLILTGLAAAIPYRMGLWNIGAEGQLFIGAWAAAGVGFLAPDLSSGLLIPLMLVAAALGGAFWILIPALARAYLQVNEIITTLLLNFVGFLWLAYWVTGPWRESSSQGGISSKSIPEQSELAHIQIGSIDVHWGILLAIGIAVVLWLALRSTTLGFELRMLGSSLQAGRYAGMPSRRRIVGVMLTGGALGGLAGSVEMMGNIHRYSDTLSNDTGYSGIVVAVLAGGSEIGVVVAGIFFAGLLAAGNALRVAGLSSNAAFALLGTILLLAAVANGLARYRVARVRRG